MGTLTARETYVDLGEALDLTQVLGIGGAVKSGQTLSNLLYGTFTTQDNMTAVGTTQGAGPLINKSIVRFTTVGLGLSATLLPSVAGYTIAVINDGVNPLIVFPAVGEQINAAGANVSFSTPIATVTLFYCVTNGFWRTK
jgi:hypothetical protein